MCLKDTIKKKLERIQNQIEKAQRKVELVAVSKKISTQAINTAYECGQKSFGESYIQEALEKIEACPSDISWHLIGRLQRNKIKYLPGKFKLIHSVDSLELAEEIDKKFREKNIVAHILFQLNLAQEKTKAGVRESEIFSLVRGTLLLPNIHVQGLMTVPPYFENPEDVRPYFKKSREILSELKKEFQDKIGSELSMGMSHDFKIAIEEGATIVRIGTAIFGERQ